MLKTNILGKDKQEKVNSIVVLAKLLDCILGSEAVSDEFSTVLDLTLFNTLFSIVSTNMSTETYKAILKISVILISGSLYSQQDSIDNYLPLYQSLIDFLDVIDIITHKLYLQDKKITLNSIKLVTDLINMALRFKYDGIITLAGRLKHVTYFSTVGNLIETEDKSIIDAVGHLKVAYFNLNEFLQATTFDLSITSHQTMLTNLFVYLESSLNEYGTPATTDEYIKAGFTSNPKNFVVENFTILLAMDLKIFLKDPNFTFKKRFHEELMMSDHSRTFPLYLFINKITKLWISIFHNREQYKFIYSSILSWELMIYYTMNNGLILWQETKAQLENETEVDKISKLIESNIDNLEVEMGEKNKTIEECLDITATKSSGEMRHNQVLQIKEAHSNKWNSRFSEFDRDLAKEVFDFVSEQRVIQLLKGSWVYTEVHGENLLKSKDKKPTQYKYIFLTLSPNRRMVYYKEFTEKPTVNPNFEEMETQFIRLADILDFKSTKVGEHIGEEDKNKNSMLISIKGTISYEKITLVGEGNKKLLSFYTDTQVNKYVWLDGLKMLKGLISRGELSDETEKQLEYLIDIRRNTQLLALERDGIDLDEDLDLLDDDEFYDIGELMDVMDDFHYSDAVSLWGGQWIMSGLWVLTATDEWAYRLMC